MTASGFPFRISFFGGGTDYPVFYREHGGSVLASTIDKYCYITCRYLPNFFEHKTRIVYSKIELVNEVNEIVHPSVRECLRFMKIDKGLEIHHDADLPARSGLGSSILEVVCILRLEGRQCCHVAGDIGVIRAFVPLAHQQIPGDGRTCGQQHEQREQRQRAAALLLARESGSGRLVVGVEMDVSR